MKKWMVFAALICLAAGTAVADVSNEVLVGFEVDSIDKAKDSTGADITNNVENDNSLFIVQYTHFFTPLKDDEKPIDLRLFYQHPSTLTAGLAFVGSTSKDNRIPYDEKTTGSVLLLGGELYLPTNTGFFLNLGIGSGTTKDNLGGPDTDHEVGNVMLGVRQYIGQSFALHLRLERDSIESKPSGFASITQDRTVTYLGARGVIADMVGLALEIGGGKREEEITGFTTEYDIAAVNFEIAGYIGKHFTVLLAVETEEEDRQGMAAGFEHTMTTTRTTLAARYWFSERFGMELPIYSEKSEDKTGTPFGGGTASTTNTGFGLYAAFRF